MTSALPTLKIYHHYQEFYQLKKKKDNTKFTLTVENLD